LAVVAATVVHHRTRATQSPEATAGCTAAVAVAVELRRILSATQVQVVQAVMAS
jgi:hypothetical protein